MKKKVMVIVAIMVVLGASAAGYLIINNANTKNCSANNGKVDKTCVNDYVGMPLSKAKQKAKNNGLFPVVASVDGKPRQILDSAINGSRPVIYFEVNDNHVTKAYFEKDRTIFGSGHFCKTFSGKQYCASDYVGLSQSEATVKAEADGLRVRVVESDKNPHISIYDDHQDRRINFSIKNGIVIKARFY